MANMTTKEQKANGITMSPETARVVEEILEAWRRDLEYGSHNLNNQASEASAKLHPHLTTTLVEIERQGIEAGMLEPPH